MPPDGAAIKERLIGILTEIASTNRAPINLSQDPAVVLMTGVNGTGKTTSIGKIAWHLRNEFGLSVLLGAADTYRAAAAEQLATWAERAGADLVRKLQSDEAAFEVKQFPEFICLRIPPEERHFWTMATPWVGLRSVVFP